MSLDGPSKKDIMYKLKKSYKIIINEKECIYKNIGSDLSYIVFSQQQAGKIIDTIFRSNIGDQEDIDLLTYIQINQDQGINICNMQSMSDKMSYADILVSLESKNSVLKNKYNIEHIPRTVYSSARIQISRKKKRSNDHYDDRILSLRPTYTKQNPDKDDLMQTFELLYKLPIDHMKIGFESLGDDAYCINFIIEDEVNNKEKVTHHQAFFLCHPIHHHWNTVRVDATKEITSTPKVTTKEHDGAHYTLITIKEEQRSIAGKYSITYDEETNTVDIKLNNQKWFKNYEVN